MTTRNPEHKNQFCKAANCPNWVYRGILVCGIHWQLLPNHLKEGGNSTMSMNAAKILLYLDSAGTP